MNTCRRILVYGNSLILSSVGARLRRYSGHEVIIPGVATPGRIELQALKPDVILFDVEGPRPEAAFLLLETCQGMVLIGLNPDGNVAKVWTGKQLREPSTLDLLRVIDSS